MNKLNKLTTSLLLLFVSVMTFAQETRPERADRFPSNNPTPEDNFATPGGNVVPIDDYAFLLIGIAVMIIAYVMYRRSQLSKA